MRSPSSPRILGLDDAGDRLGQEQRRRVSGSGAAGSVAAEPQRGTQALAHEDRDRAVGPAVPRDRDHRVLAVGADDEVAQVGRRARAVGMAVAQVGATDREEATLTADD